MVFLAEARRRRDYFVLETYGLSRRGAKTQRLFCVGDIWSFSQRRGDAEIILCWRHMVFLAEARRRRDYFVLETYGLSRRGAETQRLFCVGDIWSFSQRRGDAEIILCWRHMVFLAEARRRKDGFA